ncbi:MAG: hypothetical protein U0797_00555 [Gemmataceae bacterium]
MMRTKIDVEERAAGHDLATRREVSEQVIVVASAMRHLAAATDAAAAHAGRISFGDYEEARGKAEALREAASLLHRADYAAELLGRAPDASGLSEALAALAAAAAAEVTARARLGFAACRDARGRRDGYRAAAALLEELVRS